MGATERPEALHVVFLEGVKDTAGDSAVAVNDNRLTGNGLFAQLLDLLHVIHAIVVDVIVGTHQTVLFAHLAAICPLEAPVT